MGVIYSPLIFLTAFIETRNARRICLHRSLGEEDDNLLEEWEEMAQEINFEIEPWSQNVLQTKPNVEIDACLMEVRELKRQVTELTTMVKTLMDVRGEETNYADSTN